MRTNLVVNPKLPGIADGQQGSFIRMKQKSSHPCTMPSVHINFRLLSVFLLLLLPGFLSFCPTEIYAQAAATAKPQQAPEHTPELTHLNEIFCVNRHFLGY
jgi:hypothetical protein